MSDKATYHTFRSFYPYYLTEHAHPANRALHFVGTFLVLVLVFVGLIRGQMGLLLFVPICGYGFAWIGHFWIEKNKPATFRYPFYSLTSDFVMFFHILTGQIGKKLAEAKQLEEDRKQITSKTI